MDILKYRDGLIGKPGLVYCGRPKKDQWSQGQLLIGLGNPFSWKKSRIAKFPVKNLEESLTSYDRWTNKLIDAHKKQQRELLEPWELEYLEEMLKLAEAIKSGDVRGLICWCINIKDYVPSETEKKRCHTQSLYAACLSLV